MLILIKKKVSYPMTRYIETKDIVGLEMLLENDHHFHKQPVYQEICKRFIALASDLTTSMAQIQTIKSQITAYLLKKYKLESYPENVNEMVETYVNVRLGVLIA